MVDHSSIKKRIAVGLSGGVDSSVSAFLLKQQGYEVVGVHMLCWDVKADGCTADADRADAVKVASTLNINFEALNFVKEYKERVINYFYSEYKKGRTPNPDVMCNKEIKFGLFLDWAIKNGFDYVATGHYARVLHAKESYKLLKGIDSTKDQSYFLYLLDQKQLAKTLFPVGGISKKEVRKIARQAKLPTFEKPDSMGICFVGEVNIKDFLKKVISPKKGNVVNAGGEVLGTHDGVWFYTIGQRHGFSVEKYVGLPLYVVGKNIEQNELIVGFAGQLNRSTFTVSDVHWIGDAHITDCDVRIRHLGELHKARLTGAEVTLASPIFGVAPGQSAVFYKEGEVLGGGIIES